MSLAKVMEAYSIYLPEGHGNLSLRCPLPDHEDRRKSFSVNVDAGVWKCHGCSQSGGILHFIEAMEGISRDSARSRAVQILGTNDLKLSLDAHDGESGGSLLPAWARDKHGLNRKVSPGVRGHLPPWA